MGFAPVKEKFMAYKYEQIPGWFNYSNIFEKALFAMPNNGVGVELGTYLGKSACYLAERSQESCKPINIYTVDIFPDKHLGGKDPYLEPKIKNPKKLSFKELAVDYLLSAGVLDKIKIIDSLTSDAASLFEPDSVDFLWVDADHSYEGVLKDLTAWFPKMKPRGFISGHDYNIESVKSAVDDFFSNHNIRVESRVSWEGWYVKPGTQLKECCNITEYGCIVF